MQNHLTAEIVTFRALPGISRETLRDRAESIGPWLAACPGFLSRTLSLNDTGIWTDHIVWAHPAQAKAAGDKILAEPSAAPFMAAIEGSSVAFGHAPVILWQTACADA